MKTLRQKSLQCALRDLKYSANRDKANKVYLKWECFHTDSEFKAAVKQKKAALNKKNDKHVNPL